MKLPSLSPSPNLTLTYPNILPLFMVSDPPLIPCTACGSARTSPRRIRRYGNAVIVMLHPRSPPQSRCISWVSPDLLGHGPGAFPGIIRVDGKWFHMEPTSL